MNTYAHPVISAVLVVITSSVVVGNAIVERRSQEPAFPAYKPRPSLSEIRRHEMMVGSWVGESRVENGAQRSVLVQRFTDGTFKVTFKTRRENLPAVVEQQIGQWGIAGPVYFTITTGWIDGDQVDPTDLGQPYFYDAYHIISLAPDDFEYESFTAGTHHVMRRVADEFSINDL